MLYSYRNPGEDISQAVSLNGQPYTELPNAFRYRKEFSGAACSCRRPGQSWADALKNADDASTLEAGDIVVTDQNSKTLSQAPQPKAKPPPKGAPAPKGRQRVACRAERGARYRRREHVKSRRCADRRATVCRGALTDFRNY